MRPAPVVVVAIVLVVAHLAPVAAAIGVIGGIATLVMEVLLAIRLSLTLPALVLERTTPRAAIRRSWELTSGSFWRLFGILVLTGLIVAVAAAIITLPFTLVGGAGASSAFGFGASAAKATAVTIVVTAIGGIVASTITRPIAAAVYVLLYTDLRMRRERLDLALQAAAANPSLTGGEWSAAWRIAPPGPPGYGTWPR